MIKCPFCLKSFLVTLKCMACDHRMIGNVSQTDKDRIVITVFPCSCKDKLLDAVTTVKIEDGKSK